MKNYIKTGFSVLLFMTFLVFSIASSDDTQEISSVSDANELTDEKFKEFNEEYQELCGKKRNDKLKSKFSTLSYDISRYGEKIGSAENLSYEEQNEARKYFLKMLERNHKLEQLNYGKIECW